jgi:chitodextrinase/endonuclease I
MFKKLHWLVLLLGIVSSSLFAQIPAGYYNTATGTGYILKTQLYNIIKGQTDNGYAGLWVTYQTSDRDYFYENDGTVLDMYSENPAGADSYNFTIGTGQCGTYSVEGDCYNREHIVPQSIFNQASPMVADAHFITPTDGKVNGMRSNYPHGMVGTATYTSQNGSKLGSASNSGYAAGYTGIVFEPINEFKGDIARMYFYFATRYENVITTWGISYAMFNGTTNQVFTPTFLSILLAWNALDPVSPSEIARNNAIYARQNNRNPFIDHPEYVNLIWSTSTDIQAPTAPTNLAATAVAQTTLTLSWTAATDNVGVTGYDVYKNGTLLTSVTATTYNVTGLTAATAYTFYVKAKDAAANISVASSTINVTTTSASDTQAPTAPTNLAASAVAQTTLTLGWTASTDNVGVTGYDIYKNGTLLTSVTATTYNVIGLTAATAYTFYVKAKDAAANISLASTTINVTTASATVSYCTSKGNSVADEWISKVVVGTFTNTSTAAGYTDFTSKTITLAPGTAVSISLTPGFTSSAFNEYWRIWIDYNGDKDFDETNELAFDAGAVSNTTKTGTINVISTASGTTRMRVSMKYNAAPTACEAFSYGAVEDFTVTFGAVAPDTQAPTAPTSLAATSIAQTTLTLGWTASTDNVGVTGYDVYKNGVLLTSVTTTTYGVTGLTSATAYSFYVKAKDAAGNISAASSTINATTLAAATAKLETFANFSAGASYLTGTFLGQDGSTWSYNGARGDIAITGSAPTLGKGRTPLSYVTSGTIQGGVGTLKFDYKMAFTTTVNLNVYVNSVLVKTITGGTVNVTASSGTITVNISGAFTLKFVQVNSTSGQVAIDNIQWTSYGPVAMPKEGNTVNTEISQFKMFPNPATDFVTIQTNSSSTNQYTIIDIFGKTIESGKLQNGAQLKVSSLVNGLYFIKVTDDNGKTHIERMLKQ